VFAETSILMTSSGIDLSSYLKVVSPPRSSLHEILFNSPQPERIENDSVFCERNNVQECSEYLSAVRFTLGSGGSPPYHCSKNKVNTCI